MGILQLYCRFLLKHPAKVLMVGICFILILFVATTTIHPLPSFADPLIGFEARGTPVAARLNAWKLLLDETSASANNLSLTPNSISFDGSQHLSMQSHYFNNNLRQADNSSSSEDTDLPIVEELTQQGGFNKSRNNQIMDEDEEEYYRMVNLTHEQPLTFMHYSLGSSKAFCGKLFEGYAQMVVTPTAGQAATGLFNINSMLATCHLDKRLRLEQSLADSIVFHRDCERYQNTEQDSHKITTTCCNSWSLPNYIACLNNKTSCLELNAHDMKVAKQLLHLCAPHYFEAPYEECFTSHPKERLRPNPSINILTPTGRDLDRLPENYCGRIPEECMKCDGWTFTVLHYLTNENFMRTKSTSNDTHNSRQKARTKRAHRQNKDLASNKLTYTNIFLPMAKSSSLMSYYQALSKYSLKTPYAQVKVMNLGLRNSLFEHLISDDVKLFVMALLLILIVISVYTWSLILSQVILLIICLSLCLSYTIYELWLNIPIFPFMNLLAVVISFGICSDNAMLFCKHWSADCVGSKQDECSPNSGCPPQIASKEQINLDRMLKRAIISTFTATLATACSFIISAISKVTAVRCFCIFATLSVITNYLLIVLLLPPALILDSRFRDYLEQAMKNGVFRFGLFKNQAIRAKSMLVKLGELIHLDWIFRIVTRFNLYLIVTFLTLLICASILVFHSPTLQPADEDDVQLLSKRHAFEQYDKNLRKQFAFERAKQGNLVSPNLKIFQDSPDTLPIRVVFGVNAVDQGEHLDPLDRGKLSFDSKFNFTDPDVQSWLLEFCHKMREQRFVHPTSASEMSNCFMDTFKSWMEVRSCRDPIRPEVDRNPCCQSYDFPYSHHVIDQCIGEVVSIMRKTPQLNANSKAGIRFFKNSTRVAAVIIEFQSNRLYTDSFRKMERFFNDVDEWVGWHINNTAPPGLKSGWFISSNLELFALQTELEQSTTTSILLEVLFAMMALMVSTRDFILTMAGTLTIGTIIIVTLAALILLRWTLGVTESILISLTIGLSIDFALHYSVAYSEGLRSRFSHGVIERILGEVGGPIALATITTSLAGFTIVWSDILAYQELGVFLMLIALISWLVSTFFLLPMLATVDVITRYGESHARMIIQRIVKIFVERMCLRSPYNS